MVYKVIGLMSGSSLDGLDIVYAHLQETVSTIKGNVRKWEYSILHADCYPYTEEWQDKLATARDLPAGEYLLLHTAYGQYLGEQVLRFVDTHNLHYQVQLIASHGHTTFHLPEKKMTAQLGDGAALAAVTKINVVSDLRAMDVALGGQGAPIVPVGERLLLKDYTYFLNLGGIANVSAYGAAFDVCPANRVLNELAALAGKEHDEAEGLVGKTFDEGGRMAARGQVNDELLQRLNKLPYYDKPYPKSLANEFGTETVLPVVKEAIRGRAGSDAGVGKGISVGISIYDALRTYVEHIAVQVQRAVEGLRAEGVPGGGTERSPDGGGENSSVGGTGQSGKLSDDKTGQTADGEKMLVTGGGAHNIFLVSRLQKLLAPLGVEVVVPEAQLVDYKEALVMALIGVLRWREENNVFASVTGASRDSIGGAVWIGQEA